MLRSAPRSAVPVQRRVAFARLSVFDAEASPRFAPDEMMSVLAALALTAPLKLLAPERVTVPPLARVKVPLPEMIPERLLLPVDSTFKLPALAMLLAKVLPVGRFSARMAE